MGKNVLDCHNPAIDCNKLSYQSLLFVPHKQRTTDCL
jgi:hypothetical protein